MTPARFAQVGELLYGPSWRARLALALHIAERTVHRWLDKRPIPDTIPGELAALCDQQAAALIKMAAELRQ